LGHSFELIGQRSAGAVTEVGLNLTHEVRVEGYKFWVKGKLLGCMFQFMIQVLLEKMNIYMSIGFKGQGVY